LTSPQDIRNNRSPRNVGIHVPNYTVSGINLNAHHPINNLESKFIIIRQTILQLMVMHCVTLFLGIADSSRYVEV